MKEGEKKLGDMLEAFSQNRKYKPKIVETRIEQNWSDMMGPSVARYTQKIKVVDRKLILSITSAALKQELYYGQDRIKDIVNKMLGEEYLERVEVRS